MMEFNKERLEKLSKAELLQELLNNGYDQAFVDWAKPRSTKAKLISFLEADYTHDVIIKMASQPRNN